MLHRSIVASVSNASPRRTLSLRLQDDAEQTPAANSAEEIEAVVIEAVRDRCCISANYNRGSVVLSPALLYREHDALFLIGATLTRDGKPPREIKLGTFRLSGLTEVRATKKRADPNMAALADWNAEKPGRLLVAAPNA